MRKRSAETEVRHLKRELKQLQNKFEVVSFELARRRQIGQMMSNICFNLAQNDKYDPQHRQSMKDCREMWDSIRSVKP